MDIAPNVAEVSSADNIMERALTYREALYRVALRLTRNPDDADDLVQETFLRVLRFAHSYRQDQNLRAWLVRIMTTTFINNYRHQRTEPQSVSMDGVDGRSEIVRAHAASIGSLPSAEDEALREFADPDVVDALESLPAQFREAVLMADVRDMSYRDIALATTSNIGTVMSRISRGRRLLQQKLTAQATVRQLASLQCLDCAA